LTIDWNDLLMAFEEFDSSLDIESQHFLDTQTGEIIFVSSEADDYEEMSDRVESDLIERYVEIIPIDSHEHFRIMEDFAASAGNSRVKSRLIDALSRSKPFRRFKEVVHSDEELRKRWFAFRDNAIAEYARDWLETKGIKPNFVREGQ
jgi:hypothetical protein